MAFKQAYIQYLTEQLQKEAEEATDSNENDEFEETNENEADQTNPTPLPDPTPKPNPSPLPSPTPLPTPTDNLFKRLQKEIEETQIENAINLVDNKTIGQKIKNSKLKNNQIDQLQKIRGKRLRQLQGELYEDNVNLINRLDNVNNLNRLFDNINSNQVMTLIQISMLLQLIKKQKEKLHELRKQQIVALSNKIYDELKNNIRNERIISRLDDKGYYDSIIGEIRENFLTNRKLAYLHQLKRFQSDKLQADALFNTLSEILDFTKDLEELTNKSQITSDIQKLNQSLLTNERYIDQLDKKKKTHYHNNLYDNVEVAINIETEIKKLQNDWKIKIDAEIDQIFLLPPRSIEKIHQILEVRIATLQKPTKRPLSEDSDEENFPTRLPNNAKPVRNANGNINVQISFIVDEYKRTLNADDKKKFNRIKMDYDDKFLLTKYTKRKIEDVKVLIKNIDDYIWLMSTKKIKGTKRNRLEKDPKYKDPAQYPILFNPEKFSFSNPLGFPEEYIDDKENIKQIIIQYQQSLKNQSEISTDNLEKMQNFLINGIKTYNIDDDKKEYLHKIFKILVTRKLDDIEDDDDINNVFDSLNFTF
ncbi:hypothetical protein C2G38_2147943 [Gigaspora rosea]|uniref:Uncharacterized protein n=1 Tax=Gigaspora rosea TaxID=44941 RepID=A0A397UHQ7_9GLOM|nr:hypothetical protein C2G38_2147943 [Gigaspora rosea]